MINQLFFIFVIFVFNNEDASNLNRCSITDIKFNTKINCLNDMKVDCLNDMNFNTKIDYLNEENKENNYMKFENQYIKFFFHNQFYR